MISDDTLELAVRRAIISAEQRDRIAALAVEPAGNDTDRPSTDEPMRLVGGGNDLFVTVGIVLLFAGALFALQSISGVTVPITAAALGIFAWLVAEFVTRQRRMRLSSTVLGLGFILAVTILLGHVLETRLGLAGIDDPLKLAALRPRAEAYGMLFFGGTALAAISHFLRFRVPVMAAILALCFTGAAFFLATLHFYDGVTRGEMLLPTLEQLPDVLAKALYVPLVCGFAVFAAGLALDLRDRERFTVWSDCAFWLHVISAPLLVHPLFILATGQDVVFGEIEPGASASVMLAILIIAFVYVALAIDRRSLLVPTFAYFGSLGVYYLVNSAANTTGIPPFALILLVIGAMIILFGAGWQRIRRLIVGTTLPTSLLTKLPPMKP
ncbi:hypothetical protein [Oricola thermophila]|uniref:DUF2157 domain-containing protein n=1 Tax=Oricola thermophila TaxID=2742145 RepID=A0A6N1VFU4_9HYPH|nr:hypothetical protein [Oricola thermophila]QKV19820.1 hypothetical protein HTY61_15860 [Oricola thermophila]